VTPRFVHKDDRTIDNSLCLGDKPFRFYAGAILRTLEGWPLGTLCVLDYKPRALNELQQRVLKVHAKIVTRQLELTRALIEKVGSLNGRKSFRLVTALWTITALI